MRLVSRSVLVSTLLLLSAILISTIPAFAYDVTQPPYSATPNDSIDDSPAFSLAIQHARTNPGEIHAPAGVYLISSSVLNIDTKGITLTGEGVSATILQATTTGDFIRFGNSTPFDDCGGVSNLSIKPGPSRIGGRAITVFGCRNGRIDNVKIDRVPGHGLVFDCPSTSPETSCANWFVNHLHVEIRQGPFAAVWLNGGNDRYFTSTFIRGDRSVGSRGLLITESAGDWFTDTDIIFAEIGVSFEPAPGRAVQFLHFKNAMSDSSSENGWRLANTGGVIVGLDCASCWAGGTGLPIPGRPELPIGSGASSIGFKIRNGNGLVFTAPRIWDTGGIGFDISTPATNVQINGGWATANSYAQFGLHPGVRINASGVTVSVLHSGNPLYGYVTQSCGLEITQAADNFIIDNVNLLGNTSQGLCNSSGSGSSKIIGNVIQ